jgi:hypothetical protein
MKLSSLSSNSVMVVLVLAVEHRHRRHGRLVGESISAIAARRHVQRPVLASGNDPSCRALGRGPAACSPGLGRVMFRNAIVVRKGGTRAMSSRQAGGCAAQQYSAGGKRAANGALEHAVSSQRASAPTLAHARPNLCFAGGAAP